MCALVWVWSFFFPLSYLFSFNLYFLLIFLVILFMGTVYTTSWASWISFFYYRGKNQEPKLQWSSKTRRKKQEEDERIKLHSRRVWRKKDLKLENRLSTTLKASSILFSPNTLHQSIYDNMKEFCQLNTGNSQITSSNSGSFVKTWPYIWIN